MRHVGERCSGNLQETQAGCLTQYGSRAYIKHVKARCVSTAATSPLAFPTSGKHKLAPLPHTLSQGRGKICILAPHFWPHALQQPAQTLVH